MSGEQERAERAERARQLQGEGLSLRKIAEELGVSLGTAQRDLDPKSKGRANEAAKSFQRNLRPRVADLETTVADLSDRLATLEAAAELKQGARLPKAPSPRTKRAVAKVQQLARSQAQRTSRAKRS